MKSNSPQLLKLILVANFCIILDLIGILFTANIQIGNNVIYLERNSLIKLLLYNPFQ